jgi:hypothetical protein
MRPEDVWPDGAGGIVEMPVGTDVWELHGDGFWVLVPTNMRRKKDGSAVMGAGLARDATHRYPDLAARYGRALGDGRPFTSFPSYRLLLGPTKDDWRPLAKMQLVEELLDGAARWCRAHQGEALAVAVPGCGHGGLGYGPVRGAAVWRLAAYRVALLLPLRGAK